MSTAIHIEINLLFLIIMIVIAYQSKKNVNQQMKRLLFRYTTYGIIGALVLDTFWMLVDGRQFPGAIALNWFVNALFLSVGVFIGSIWYLYVLETLGYKITTRITSLVMLPAALDFILCFISLKTGWIFYIDESNVYTRGSLFSLQIALALGMLFLSLIHIVICLLRNDQRTPKPVIERLLRFYIVPVIGTVAAVPFSGMPGTWTCASVSVVLIYLSSQDDEILQDSLTGLNNRKVLDSVFPEYLRQPSEEKQLFLFIIDLNDFKKINDTYGHPVGDHALIEASKMLKRSMAGIRGIVARIGGDEFVILGFLKDESEAQELIGTIHGFFDDFNSANQVPYTLSVCIGYCACEKGEDSKSIMQRADENLYKEKKRLAVGR